MSVTGVQNFLSAAIARQVKPDALSASASAPSNVVDFSTAEETSSYSSLSGQSLSTTSFSGASASVAQLGSVLQVTQGGVDQVQALLQQLQNLAGQPAAGTVVSSATLAQIDSQFQQILAQIDRIAAQTTFNGASLLDGTFSGQQLAGSSPEGKAAPSPSLSLPNLTTSALFGNEQPNLLTQQAAIQALAVVGNAKGTVGKASDELKTAQSQVEFASASLQTALANVDASTATLSDSELAGVFGSLLGNLAQEPVASIKAQTSNLPPSLLSLLQE